MRQLHLEQQAEEAMAMVFDPEAVPETPPDDAPEPFPPLVPAQPAVVPPQHLMRPGFPAAPQLALPAAPELPGFRMMGPGERPPQSAAAHALAQNAFAEGARFCQTIMQAQIQQSMEMQALRGQLAETQQQLVLALSSGLPSQRPPMPPQAPGMPAQDPAMPAQDPAMPAQDPAMPAQDPAMPAEDPADVDMEEEEDQDDPTGGGWHILKCIGIHVYQYTMGGGISF